MADDVRRWSDELARDPASLVFLPLGETLRRQGQLDLALKIAMRGLERHSHNTDAHDLLARIAVDRGELQRAFDEWDMVLRLTPGHLGALKGMAFVRFQQGNAAEAEEYLRQAAEQGGDAEVVAALTNLRSRGTRDAGRGTRDDRSDNHARPAAHVPRPADVPHPAANDPRALFADILGQEEQTALLLDDQGLVLAGIYMGEDGQDVAAEVGAELSGVTDAARRATKHLDIGEWRAIVLETEVAVVTMAPSAGDGLLVVAASKATPLGLVRRVLDRCLDRARQWLEGSQ
ncbi:MAG: roadblock/LC7 domain-containing protein [Gemmatimonadetes bacterium]|jgi:predicted regulator of Ras-like GTPase activity (Roadblock/LC7/MglB family)|nr:roadblock/LC7 domain-containing protein [Gemmatimonadota bacterium]